MIIDGYAFCDRVYVDVQGQHNGEQAPQRIHTLC